MARILVIEDNPANLELMTYLLRAFGHMPLAAEDGEEGMELARREMPDLIVCDVQLPRLDGYEVARQLKTHPTLRAIPLVAVTALAMVGDRDRVLAAGFDGYIPKPIAPETFVEQAEAFLRPDQRFPPPQPHSATPAAEPSPPKGVQVLVVDNVSANRDLLRSLLEPLGYQVIDAGSVSEALARARQFPPDLILSDLHMPRETGFELLQKVKADPQLRGINVVIHSATMMSRDDRARALALGAVKFVQRPIEPQELLKEIEACLMPHPPPLAPPPSPELKP